MKRTSSTSSLAAEHGRPLREPGTVQATRYYAPSEPRLFLQIWPLRIQIWTLTRPLAEQPEPVTEFFSELRVASCEEAEFFGLTFNPTGGLNQQSSVLLGTESTRFWAALY